MIFKIMFGEKSIDEITSNYYYKDLIKHGISRFLLERKIINDNDKKEGIDDNSDDVIIDIIRYDVIEDLDKSKVMFLKFILYNYIYDIKITDNRILRIEDGKVITPLNFTGVYLSINVLSVRKIKLHVKENNDKSYKIFTNEKLIDVLEKKDREIELLKNINKDFNKIYKKYEYEISINNCMFDIWKEQSNESMLRIKRDIEDVYTNIEKSLKKITPCNRDEFVEFRNIEAQIKKMKDISNKTY